MEDKLRVLIVTSSLTGGGAGNHILNLCRYLGSVSINPYVLSISAEKHELENIFEDEGISVFHNPLRTLAGIASRRWVSDLKEITRTVRPDILHGHLYHGEIVASLISRLIGIPAVSTRHSSGLEFNGSRKWLARMMSGRIGAAIAVSRAAAEEAADAGIPSERIAVIPNGVDTSRFRLIDEPDKARMRKEFIREFFPGNPPAESVLVGAAGALKAVKNHSLLIRIASKVLSSDPVIREKLRFVIAGEGELREELEAQVAELDLTRYISFPGYINGLEDFFSSLDIFMVTSDSEGVPIALLEAMSSGVACVSSDVGDIAEVVGDTGFMVPSGEEAEFVDIVKRLVVDNAGRIELGRRARLRVLENFDMEIWGSRTVEVYRKLTG